MARVCVDAVGGDEDPKVVLAGIQEALKADSTLSVLVAGPEDIVVPFCARFDRARALVCTEQIDMDEHPAEAVRQKRDSSIVRGLEAVKKGEADAFFSAGSTGAIFAAATLHVGRIKGIKRPAIACSIPGSTGRRTVFMDMGANADVRPEMIVQFAQMGRAYAKLTSDALDPTVALLNNGSEETKGSEIAQQYHQALLALGTSFKGNCEGTDILAGRFDVIVTDGFSGNIAVKTLEGTAKYLLGEIKKIAKSSVKAALAALILKPYLKEVAKGISGDAYGGAVLLGTKAPVLIGHGATSVEAIKNGTLAAAKCVSEDLVARISEEIE